MSYKESLARVNSLLAFGIKPGLERVSELLHRLNNPQNKLKFVHVAGTNGKGSTCTMLSSILKQAGFSVGLFTSPYVIDFRERMQINGKMISESEIETEISDVMRHVNDMAEEGLIVTEFEVITAIALKWFAKNMCDIVVLEVGLGGRYDATNVISTPLVSVISSISLDHVAILGDTIEKIALEKCGIIKDGGSTVSYPDQLPEALAVIMEQAALKGNTLHIGNLSSAKILHEDIYGTMIKYDTLNIQIPLPGHHQIANAITAIETAKVLSTKGFLICDEHILAGIASAYIPARIEVLCREPLVILDGAHNPDGTKVLADSIQQYLCDRRIIAIMGMMSDKDYQKAVENIAPLCDKIICVKPDNARSLSAVDLAKEARKYCDNVDAQESISKALKLAFKENTKKDAVIICGSLYLASDIRQLALNTINKTFAQKY